MKAWRYCYSAINTGDNEFIVSRKEAGKDPVCFNGYDFMGGVNWCANADMCAVLDETSAWSIIRDLLAAE